MSVLVKGMEMPKSCWLCSLSQLYENPRVMLVCKITHEEVLRHKIDSNCPLVELPPHGRLIDADALSEYIVECSKRVPKNSFEFDLCGEVITQVALAPTIIEAEGENDGKH